MKIKFSQHAYWDLDRASVVLTATIGGKRVCCAVPQDHLTAPYVLPPNEEKALKLFNKQRRSIESKLRQRIEKGAFEANGEMVILSV